MFGKKEILFFVLWILSCNSPVQIQQEDILDELKIESCEMIYAEEDNSIIGCSEGCIEIENSCYIEQDINVLNEIISLNIDSLNMDYDFNNDGIINLLELGIQEWENGRLIVLGCWGFSLFEIPQSIGNLTKLENLNLGFNNISNLPESIGNLTNLNFLSFFNNHISSVPNTFERLTNIEYLNFRENEFSKIPIEICSFEKLEYLDFIINHISEVPECIGDLTKLEELRLGENQIISVPESISNLTNLEYLSLTNNLLIEIPNSIGNLTNLKGLYLSLNKLKKIPRSIAKLDSLQYLQLSSNEITHLPPNFCEFKPLWDYEQFCGNSSSNFTIFHNNLCPPYPECIEDIVFYQDCGVNSNFNNN